MKIEVLNRVTLSLSLFQFQRENEHLIAVEVAPHYLLEGDAAPSCIGHSEYVYEWSIEDNEEGETQTDLVLKKINVFESQICKVSLPLGCAAEMLAHEYALNVLKTYDMRFKTVEL